MTEHEALESNNAHTELSHILLNTHAVLSVFSDSAGTSQSFKHLLRFGSAPSSAYCPALMSYMSPTSTFKIFSSAVSGTVSLSSTLGLAIG